MAMPSPMVRIRGRARSVRPLAAALLLGGCAAVTDVIPDVDLRRRNDGFSTAAAASSFTSRPQPDDRGVISYPTYQVVVAREGDTIPAVAARLGLDAGQLAAHNGLDPATTLRRDEVLALPGRVGNANSTAASSGIAPAATGAVSVTELASAAIDRADQSRPAPAPVASAAPVAAVPAGVEPIRHQVARGETAYSVARLYGVPVRTLAEWNGLGPDLALREGQQLLVPQGTAPSEPVQVAAPEPLPGEGSLAPVPPSADQPLPEEEITVAPEAEAEPPVASPDLGATQSAAPSAAFVSPADGAIIRAFSPGRSEGIDIGASAGAPVRAADAGTVRAITTDANGIDIVVIRHADDLLTIYTHLENLSVETGNAVSRGQQIGTVRAGDPAILHFRVYRGQDVLDPTDYLP